MNNRKVVEMVVREAPARIKELIAYGTRFDKVPDGDYDLAMEGGIPITEFCILKILPAQK